MISVGMVSAMVLFIGACGKKDNKDTSSLASFEESCKLTTKVENIARIGKVNGTTTEVDPKTVIIKVTGAELVGGHTNCQDHIGRSYALILNGSAFAIGEEVKFAFSQGDGLTPDGVVEYLSWEIIQ